MTSSKQREVLVAVVVEDVDEVEGVVELALVVEVEVAALSVGHVEVRGAPLIHEYAILCLQCLLLVSFFFYNPN